MPALSKKAAKVDTVRAELANLLPRFALIRDCVEGQEKIKSKTTSYLPKPNASDTSPENETRYKQYVERAVWYAVTERTLAGMVGTVFQRAPEVEVPPALDMLKQDADGGGVGLDQQSKKALSTVIQFGRAGLLVDFPKRSTAASVADVESGRARPMLTLWQPEDVINWRTALVGGVKLLTLVVLSEKYVSNDDGFDAEESRQFRVLRLVEGVYRCEIWRQDATAKDFLLTDSFEPTNAAGERWPFIPFSFIGSENNDEFPDEPPLYNLATLNIAHYRNSADYEEACYMLGQPTPWASGLTKDWVDDVLKGKISLGSRALIPLPENSQVGLLQVQPNTMPKEAMEHKEKQMIALGAKLVEQRDVRQTATEASQNEASETSVLATSANNVSAAYSEALKRALLFVSNGKGEKITYKINTEFAKRLASAADRQQLVAEWQANAITTSEMRAALKKIGVATLDDEEFKDEIESAGPDLGSPVKRQEQDDAAAALAAKSKPAPAV